MRGRFSHRTVRREPSQRSGGPTRRQNSEQFLDKSLADPSSSAERISRLVSVLGRCING